MKKILAIFIALLCYCTSVFANEQEARASFNEIANEVQIGISKTDNDDYASILFNKNGNFWYKTRFASMKVTHDMAKSNSSDSPYMGVLWIDWKYAWYFDAKHPEGRFRTRAEALNAKSVRFEDGGGEQIAFIYWYKNEEWVITKRIYYYSDGKYEEERFLHSRSEDAINIPIASGKNYKQN